MTRVTRVAMWSGPRNLSTAMMRSWENRADTTVIDEPLYARYLDVLGLDHPSAAEIIAAGPADFDDAVATCLAPLPEGITVNYQKHMAHHLLPGDDRTWLDELTHALLLRDPRRVLDSYTKVREHVTLDEIGLPQQVELASRARIIIDAADFLAQPETGLRLLCEAVGVDFDPDMLAWPAGPRDSDGLWARHWYASVEASTSFSRPAPADLPRLPPHLQAIAEEAMDLYIDLHTKRTRLE